MNRVSPWMKYNKIESIWGFLWDEAWKGAIVKKFDELRRKLRVPINNGLRMGIKLY